MNPLRVLHVFSTFAPGGPQVRTVELMNLLGPGFTHLVTSMDGVTTAAGRVRSGVDFQLVEAPAKAGTTATARSAARLIARYRPGLVATYNWGAIETAMGAVFLSGCPLLHAEDGFGPEEAQHLLRRRVWTRRFVLRFAKGVVVPSRSLERIALHQYRLPRGKVVFLPNGVDTVRFAPAAGGSGKARFGFEPSNVVVGAVGHLRPEKNLGLLLDAFAMVRAPGARLLLAGDGPARPELERRAAQLGIAPRVMFAGMLADTVEAYQAMDIFAMSSSTEQMPLALLEAMASGLPAVVTDVGDCAVVLARSAPPSIVPPGDAAALAASLETMIADADVRAELGAANRALCAARFARADMVDRYGRLYRWAAGLVPALEVHS